MIGSSSTPKGYPIPDIGDLVVYSPELLSTVSAKTDAGGYLELDWSGYDQGRGKYVTFTPQPGAVGTVIGVERGNFKDGDDGPLMRLLIDGQVRAVYVERVQWRVLGKEKK